MSELEVERNAANRIIDTDGNDLETIAIHHVDTLKAEDKAVLEEDERISDLPFAEDSGAPNTKPVKGAFAVLFRLDRAEAKIAGVKHFNDNKTAYHQAAIDEDEIRSK